MIKRKIYVEDYVITYLNQLADTGGCRVENGGAPGEAKRQEDASIYLSTAPSKRNTWRKDGRGHPVHGGYLDRHF